ncbi:hypothetical protein H072_7239 [Dactylellina haptotyla CBS 200.50]|uniref:Retrovirus-related Pol polyprotein from transposon TNT 1-94-like beta-barrel domain-containing protein n=1 Tax=Dactylellina haptotyla (strain CBS 200.50) TaxID=1284197 RepID=S8AD01_DACHA|nr:hypothetical protein H072_7239 [Dactylellina haptotyla CBS 200.50]
MSSEDLYCGVCKTSRHDITTCHYITADSCTICHRNNHTNESCYYKDETDPTRIKKLSTCSRCHRVGHSFRSCWELEANYDKRPGGYPRGGNSRKINKLVERDGRIIMPLRPRDEKYIRTAQPKREINTEVLGETVPEGAEVKRLSQKVQVIAAAVSDELSAPKVMENATRKPATDPIDAKALGGANGDSFDRSAPLLDNDQVGPSLDRKGLGKHLDDAMAGNRWEIHGMWTASIDYTYHISHDWSDFDQLEELETPMEVKMRNGKYLIATKYGIYRPRICVGEKRRRLKLANTLYLPEFDGKVMSVGKMVDGGFKVEMTGHIINFFGDGVLKAQALWFGDRYIFISEEELKEKDMRAQADSQVEEIETKKGEKGRNINAKEDDDYVVVSTPGF